MMRAYDIPDDRKGRGRCDRSMWECDQCGHEQEFEDWEIGPGFTPSPDCPKCGEGVK